MSLKLNLSEAFYNKENRTNNKGAFGYSFHPKTLELPALVKHIRTGKAFTVGHFKDNRRVEAHFVSSQLLALDLDQCPLDIDALEGKYPFLQQHAFMMYPTPSSIPAQPKTRVLFVLDEPVEMASRWRVLQLAVMEQFAELKPDEACKDPARLFYGCFTSRYHVNYRAVLQIATIANVVRLQADRDDFQRLSVRYTTRIQRTGTDLERCAANFLNHALRKVASAGKGERHQTFRNYAQWLYGLHAGGWPINKADIERELTAISLSWGDKDNAAVGSLKWAEANAKAITPDENKISSRGHHVQNMMRHERYSVPLPY